MDARDSAVSALDHAKGSCPEILSNRVSFSPLPTIMLCHNEGNMTEVGNLIGPVSIVDDSAIHDWRFCRYFWVSGCICSIDCGFNT